MTYESAKDPRLLLAERAIDTLQENFRQKIPVRLEIPKADLQKVLSGAKSAIMAVKYSYQAPTDLAKDENVLKLVMLGRRLLEQISHAKTPETPPNLALSRIEWGLRVLAKLADNLKANISRYLQPHQMFPFHQVSRSSPVTLPVTRRAPTWRRSVTAGDYPASRALAPTLCPPTGVRSR